MTLDYKKAAKLKVAEVMKDLPKKLKNPKCYPEIEKRLALIMYSDHKHPTVKSFMKCSRCIAKHQKKLEAIREYGFSGVPQYLGWKKIMDIIYNKRSITVSSKLAK